MVTSSSATLVRLPVAELLSHLYWLIAELHSLYSDLQYITAVTIQLVYIITGIQLLGFRCILTV